MSVVTEQRRKKRFDLELPVEVLNLGCERMSQSSMTRNISSGGVLFRIASRMELGSPVKFVVTLTSGGLVYCTGKVVRIEIADDAAADESVAVAISFDQYELIRSQCPVP